MLLTRIRCPLQQQLLLLLLTIMATNRATAETSSMGHGDDEAALLAFKAKISHHSGVHKLLQLGGRHLQQETPVAGGRSGPQLPGA